MEKRTLCRVTAEVRPHGSDQTETHVVMFALKVDPKNAIQAEMGATSAFVDAFGHEFESIQIVDIDKCGAVFVP